MASATQTTDWNQFAYDAARDGYNPFETTLGPRTVGSLHLKWSAKVDVGILAQPLLVRSVSISGTFHDALYVVGFFNAFAMDANTGSILWKRPLPGSTMNCGSVTVQEGAWATPYIDKATNRIYLADGADNFDALNMTSGQIVYSKHLDTYSNTGVDGAISYSPSLQRAYVETALRCGNENVTTPMRGRILALAANGTGFSKFITVTTAGFYGGGIWAQGGASIDSSGNVYASSGNSWPTSTTFGEHIDYAEHVLKWTPALALSAANYPGVRFHDKDFGATPALFTPTGCAPMLALSNKDGDLLFYNRNAIASGPIATFTMANPYPGDFIDAPAWDPVTQRIYETSSTDSAASPLYKHGFSAFGFSGCRPTFAMNVQEGTAAPTGTNAPDDPYSPAVIANGVVYFGAGYTNEIFANDAMTGYLLWHSRVLAGHTFTPPIVVNGRLYFADAKGIVYAYGL